MDIRLIPDLVRQWIDIVRLKNEMYHDLPQEFRDGWKDLPWKRYQYFYGVLVPVVIHDALFRLHETPITKKLRKVISAQALVTGVFDDLFDRLHLPADRIRRLMETPEYIISSDFPEEYLCQYLFQEMQQHFTGNHRLFDGSVRAILYAQELSKHQRQHPSTFTSQNDVSIYEILHITKEKGAKAVLFYRSCIDQAVAEDEDAFLAELGELFQMTNDINDALKDQQAGETTFMTMGLSLREIREIFDTQIKQTFDSWKLLSNDLYDKKGFFSRINILVARSLVTLDRYNRLVDPAKPFDIGDIPKNRIISGLAIPYEVGGWLRHYTSMNGAVKSPASEE